MQLIDISIQISLLDEPNREKYYLLKTHHIKCLIIYIEKDGVLENYKNIPETVYDELYKKEQERQKRQRKDKCKEAQIIGTEVSYPFCNIYNILPSQPIAQGFDISDPKAAVEQMTLSPLEIPGPRDVAVKKYSEWQKSNVENDTLKSAFRQVYDVILDNGFDLEQVYKDQDPKFFIEKGIKIGTARRFVEDIGKWAEQLKKAIPLCEIL